MAIVRPIADEAALAAWIAERPPIIQEMIRRCPPNRLYRIDSGHRVTIYSYSEDRTVTVEVTGEYNRVIFGRRVFGISIDQLIECDPPAPGEDVGDTAVEAGYTEEEVQTILIPQLKANQRADTQAAH